VKSLTYLRHSAEQLVLPLIAALGIGALFQVRFMRSYRFPDRLTCELDSAYWTPSRDASEGYGYKYRSIWVHQVGLWSREPEEFVVTDYKR